LLHGWRRRHGRLERGLSEADRGNQ
jgi:hypothetical protein